MGIFMMKNAGVGATTINTKGNISDNELEHSVDTVNRTTKHG